MVDHEQVLCEDRGQWRAWLQAHHESGKGVWLVRWKKGSGHPHLGYDDAVEEALCFGWIDSQSRTLDDQRGLLLMTPRKPRSGWSRSNKQRIERLLATGLMAPAGLAALETAKANGAWAALDDVEDLREGADLAAALDAVPAARRSWDGFPRSARRGILEWISTARTPATRARRIATTVAEAAEGRRANQWPARRY